MNDNIKLDSQWMLVGSVNVLIINAWDKCNISISLTSAFMYMGLFLYNSSTLIVTIGSLDWYNMCMNIASIGYLYSETV